MRLNCAIFDMDGTVLDSMQAWVDAIAHILTRRGITPPADLREITRPMNGILLVDYLQREFLPVSPAGRSPMKWGRTWRTSTPTGCRPRRE